MYYINDLYHHVDDELTGCQMYAEESIKVKARGNSQWASRFKEMASQELQHAQYLHEYVIQEITNIKTVYNPTEEEIEKWDKCDRKFYEKEAMLKVMLSM